MMYFFYKKNLFGQWSARLEDRKPGPGAESSAPETEGLRELPNFLEHLTLRQLEIVWPPPKVS